MTNDAAPPSAAGATAGLPRGAPCPAGQAVGVFYGQLGGLLKAGMPLPQALRTLAAEAGSARFREALERAAAAIENGVEPDRAFAREEAALGGMLGRVAATTAFSGRLAQMLAELSGWTLAQDRIRRQISDAVAYPYMVLLLAAVVTGIVMYVASYYGVPGLENEFADFGPPPAAFETTITPALAWCVIIGTLALTLCVPLFAILARFSRGVRHAREYLLIYLPVFGAVARPLALSRFCGSVAILLKAGVSYHQAVAAGGELTGFEPYAAAARKAAQVLEAGQPQAEAWSETRLFPASLRFILASAEKRGDIPDAFAELAELYRVEAEGRGRVVAVLAPPACLVGVGLVVAVCISALLGPLVRILSVLDRF